MISLNLLSVKNRRQLFKLKVFDSPLCLVFLSIFISPFIFFNQFHDPYTTIKWICVLSTFVLSIFLYLNKKNDLVFPKLHKYSLNILLLILIMSIANVFLQGGSFFSFEVMYRLIFWGATLFFFNLFFTEGEECFDKITKFFQFISGIFLAMVFFSYIAIPKHPLHFTFGNIAHSSEYIGLCLALQFGSLVRLWRQSKTSWKLDSLCALSLAYIYLSQSRCTIIGVIFILLAAILLRKKYIVNILKILIYSLSFVIITAFLMEGKEAAEAITVIGNKDYNQRWLIYINTLKMIFDNPLGVGLGQYQFSAIPYLKSVKEFDETTIFNTPHNDFLHILAEDGVILSFLFLSFALSLIYFLWNDFKRIFYSYPEFIFFSLMLFPLSTFQFPLLNPVPSLMCAMMVGFFFSLRKKEVLSYPLGKKTKRILMGINGIALFIFISTFGAKYVSYNFPTNQSLNKIACTVGNQEWLGCLNVAASYLDAKDYEKAATYARQTLTWNPHNYQGLRLLAFAELYKGNRKKGCDLLKTYSALFRDPTLIRPLMDKECQSFL